MLVDLHTIVVQIQFPYHFNLQTSMFQLGLTNSQNIAQREKNFEFNIKHHEFLIAPNFEGSAICMYFSCIFSQDVKFTSVYQSILCKKYNKVCFNEGLPVIDLNPSY